MRAAEPTEAEIKALIEQLASPNAAPSRQGPDAVYPKNYDNKAQAKVWEAYRKLEKLGPVSFELLAQNIDDERYSLTGDGGAADANFNVGFLCRWILEQQICPFEKTVYGEGYTRGHPQNRVVEGPRGKPPLRPDFISYLGKNPVQAKQWAKGARMLDLHLIQRSALEWMIAEEEKDPKTYDEVERTALKVLHREMAWSNSALHSKKWFLSK
jgi:hypothetical protein